MKRVSFNIAKAIKEAGYPQDIQEVYKENGEYFVSYIKYNNTFAAPLYLSVWLWLWQEKKIILELQCQRTAGWSTPLFQNRFFNNQEEALIAAIEHLVENNLIN